MINNTCIYGTVTDGVDPIVDSTVRLRYVKYDFSVVLDKEWDNTTGAYQFHLGDADMLTLNTGSYKDDVVIISNTNNGNSDATYSDKLVLGEDRYYELDIVDDGSLVIDSEEASADDESTNTIARSIILNETSESLYSYYEVSVDGEVVHGEDCSRLVYNPAVVGEHKVVHSAVNSTTAEISVVEYTIDVQQSRVEIESIDYVFYSKRKKVLRAELPQHVKDTLILADGWYYEGGMLMGKHEKLGQLEMDYYNGKVIVKGYIGDIIDY